MIGARAILTRSLWGLAVLLALAGSRAALAQSRLDGAEGFGVPGTNGIVFATAVYDDGSGPALYAGGDFTTAGGRASVGIGKWAVVGEPPTPRPEAR